MSVAAGSRCTLAESVRIKLETDINLQTNQRGEGWYGEDINVHWFYSYKYMTLYIVYCACTIIVNLHNHSCCDTYMNDKNKQGSKKASMQLDYSRSSNFLHSRDSSVCVLPLKPQSAAVSYHQNLLTSFMTYPCSLFRLAFIYYLKT